MASIDQSPRRPTKRCARCGVATARMYHWWIEETPIRFVCDACRTGAAVPLAEPLRTVEPTVPSLDLLGDED